LQGVCSRLSADEATAEAAKSAILTRFSTGAQDLSLILLGISSPAVKRRERGPQAAGFA